MNPRSAFHIDNCGNVFAYQDPDENLDWSFDFQNSSVGNCLLVGENIATMVFDLTRIDGEAIVTETTHDPTNLTTIAGVFVKGLLGGIDYNLECTIATTATPPRQYTRSFSLLCRAR